MVPGGGSSGKFKNQVSRNNIKIPAFQKIDFFGVKFGSNLTQWNEYDNNGNFSNLKCNLASAHQHHQQQQHQHSTQHDLGESSSSSSFSFSSSLTNNSNKFSSSSMMLRRHDHDQTTTTTTDTNTSSSSSKTNKLKHMMTLMKQSCPSYFYLPRSTRKRILRFLCDNAWLDVVS